MYKTKDALFLVTFKHKTHHFVFTVSRVQHKAQEQLCSNAAQSPHVDGCCVRKSQDDLWSSMRGNTDTLFMFVCCNHIVEFSEMSPAPYL